MKWRGRAAERTREVEGDHKDTGWVRKDGTRSRRQQQLSERTAKTYPDIRKESHAMSSRSLHRRQPCSTYSFYTSAWFEQMHHLTLKNKIFQKTASTD